MDISSAAATTINICETGTSSQTQRSSKSDVSFQDEMKKVSESDTKETSSTQKDDKSEKSEKSDKSDKADKTDAENKADKQQDKSVKDEDSDKNKEQNSQNSDGENNTLLTGEVSVNDLQNAQKNGLLNSNQLNNIQMLVNANQQLSDVTRLAGTFAATKVDYSNIAMGADDAKFFSDLVKNADKTLQGVVSDLQSGIEQKAQQAAKNVKISSTLMNALQDAVKTNQPFRINFDKDVSVIIKVNKDGALSATFIPGDKAVEEYLRQNISTLRQRFDEQDLPYSDLSYSRQKQNQEQNRRNNKEKDHE